METTNTSEQAGKSRSERQVVRKHKANRRQLNVDLDLPVYNALVELSNQQGKHIRDVVQVYVEHGLAVDRGEMIEVEALPHMKRLLRAELERVLEQLRLEQQSELQKELLVVTKVMKKVVDEVIQKSTDRIIAMIVMGIRESGIAAYEANAILRHVMIEISDKPQVEFEAIVEQAHRIIGQKLARKRGDDTLS